MTELEEKPAMQQSVDDATDLLNRIDAAICGLARARGENHYYDDSIEWRFDAIHGMLMIALSEVQVTRTEWKQLLEEELGNERRRQELRAELNSSTTKTIPVEGDV